MIFRLTEELFRLTEAPFKLTEVLFRLTEVLFRLAGVTFRHFAISCFKHAHYSLFALRFNCVESSPQNHLNKLLILQKRAHRFIYFSDRHDHAIPLFVNAHFTYKFYALQITSRNNA